jgi:hypothetical protein
MVGFDGNPSQMDLLRSGCLGLGAQVKSAQANFVKIAVESGGPPR